MGTNRTVKEQIVSEVKEDLKQAKSVIITDYRGLNVAQMTSLRRSLHSEKIKYVVVKNTLAKLAARELGLEELDVYFEGPTAIAFGFEDPVTPAKVLSKYAKDFDKLEIKGGLLEGKLIGLASVKALADLPSREILLGRVVGAFAAPMTGFAGAMQGILRKFVYTLDAVREQKEASQV
ncbi:MAG: 50S ribosomal protein L10 [Dethiobacter sp.]|jgi:large subunit ribosomal protein L10|nr:50S ribosomal protein L10 [Dethiobacter sp.]